MTAILREISISRDSVLESRFPLVYTQQPPLVLFVRPVRGGRQEDGAWRSGTRGESARRLGRAGGAEHGCGHDAIGVVLEHYRDREFESCAHKDGVPHNQAREFLKAGVKSGKILLRVVGRKREHRLRDGVAASAYATAVFDVTNHQTVTRSLSHADRGLRSLGAKPSQFCAAPSPPREQRSRIRRKFTSDRKSTRLNSSHLVISY